MDGGANVPGVFAGRAWYRDVRENKLGGSMHNCGSYSESAKRHCRRRVGKPGMKYGAVRFIDEEEVREAP